MSELYLPRDIHKISANHPLARLFDIPLREPNRDIQLLYRTVILRALYEGLKGCSDARTWLLIPSPDMTDVSDFANLCPHWIRRISREILQRKHPMPPYRVWRYLWADLQQKNADNTYVTGE